MGRFIAIIELSENRDPYCYDGRLRTGTVQALLGPPKPFGVNLRIQQHAFSVVFAARSNSYTAFLFCSLHHASMPLVTESLAFCVEPRLRLGRSWAKPCVMLCDVAPQKVGAILHGCRSMRRLRTVWSWEFQTVADPI